VAQPAAILTRRFIKGIQETGEGIVALALEKEQLKVIAAIPAYNEEKYIAAVVKKTAIYVDEVYVIDDGSTDRTVQRARAAGATVISHPENKGKGEALNTAFELARDLQPEVLVLLDGDNQHDADEIPLLLDQVMNNGCDMVVGSRFLRKNGIPAYRQLGQHVLTITTNLGSGIRLTDSQSGFRAFSWAAVRQMRFAETGLSVESEMQFLAGRKGFQVSEVPIVTNYDDEVKRSPVVHGVGVLLRVIGLTLRSYLSQSNAKGECMVSRDDRSIVSSGSLRHQL
jgi:glycosyltransferase involved in cell wall biosynthesis